MGVQDDTVVFVESRDVGSCDALSVEVDGNGWVRVVLGTSDDPADRLPPLGLDEAEAIADMVTRGAAAWHAYRAAKVERRLADGRAWFLGRLAALVAP